MRTSALFFLCLVFIVNEGCKKKEDNPVLETGAMTDIDNNAYSTIKIGNQWWMAEDLKVTHYRNGVSIKSINVQTQSQSDSLDWVTDLNGAFCKTFNNGNVEIGKFYNWYAVSNSNQLAPAGWHIPSDEEWKAMERSLGMNTGEIENSGWRGNHEGEKLKTMGPDGWTTYDGVWGNNESGFNAFAKGCRLFNARPADPGYFVTGFWWTSTAQSPTESWYRNLDYKKTNVFRSHCLKNFGFSVRCVKD